MYIYMYSPTAITLTSAKNPINALSLYLFRAAHLASACLSLPVTERQVLVLLLRSLFLVKG